MTTMVLSIRKALPGDDAALLPMVEDFYDRPEYDTPPHALAAHLRAMLSDQRSIVFIAEDEGKAVGFAAAFLSVGLEFGTMAEVEDLYVIPERRGQKVGSQLMLSVLDWCKNAGADEVSLVIAQQGEPARQLERLYLSLGFQPSRRRLMYRPLNDGE